VTYQNTLASATGSRTIELTATNINANTSAVVTRTVNIVQHVAPTIAPATGSLSYPRGAPAIPIDNVALTVSDSDSTSLTGARVVVTDGYVNGQDVLEPTGPLVGSISASFSAGTGTLSLTGTGTPAEYTQALRLVKYRNTNGGASGTRTVSFFATDDASLTSQAVTRTVTIVSQAVPVIAPSTGTLSYTAGAPATVVDGSFTISDADSTNLNNTAGLRVSISPYFGNQDRLGTSASLSTDFTTSFDINTGVLTISCNTNCPKTVLQWQTALRTVTYQNILAAPDIAPRTISIVATDTDTNASAPATRNVTIIGASGPPSISGLPASDTINEDTPKTYPVTLADIDTSLSDLTIAATSSDQTIVPDANLSIGGTGGARTLSITPAPNQFTSGTPVTITVSASDGTSTTTATLALTVDPVDDAPTIQDVTDRSTAANAPITIPFMVGDIDTDPATLTMSLTSSNPALVPASPSASVVFGGAGVNRTVTITPVANQVGSTVVGLVVSDGTLSTTDTFTLTVTASGSPTISAIPNQSTSKNKVSPPIAFTIGDPDTPVGGLTLSAASSNSAVVAVSGIVFSGSGANRTVTVTPVTDASGSSTISINVSDGVNTAITTFLMTIAEGVPSVASVPGLTVQEGGTVVVDNSKLKATDTDNSPDQLIFTLVSGPSQGTLKKNGAALGSTFSQADVDRGSISYTHNGAQNPSTDGFTFTLTDGVSTLGPIPFSITITPKDDAPRVSTNQALTVAQGRSGPIGRSLLEATDPDNGASDLVFTITDGPAKGEVRRSGASVKSFTQDDINRDRISYVSTGTSGDDSFAFRVSDGTLTSNLTTFTISITPVGPVTPSSCDLDPSSIGSTLNLGPYSTVSNGVRTATVCESLHLTTDSAIGKIVLEIPAQTTFRGSASTWDGKINLPSVLDNSVVGSPTLNGRPTAPTAVVQLGTDSQFVDTDQGLKLTIPGHHGQMAFFKRGTSITAIGTDCSTMCWSNSGNDLLITTKSVGGQYVTYSDGCTPRPDVKIATTVAGTAPDKYLTSTITATTIGTAGSNRLIQIRFSKKSVNATVDVNGKGINLNDTSPDDFVMVTLPPDTSSIVVNIHRIDPTKGVTVPLVAVDACGGEWPSLVGGGVDAFK